MRIFVSYTTKDPFVSKDSLEKVEARLKPFGRVFIDMLHNEKGNQKKVDCELQRCDAVIQLMSPQHPSEWVQKELLTARKKGKPVVKVELDKLLAKDDEELYLLLSDIDKKGWSVWGILTVALLVCMGISFLGIWLSYIYVSKQSGADDIMNARGVFGDSWGGVNALISAFAFAGVIVTLFLQNRDLNLQRKEMARQREEFEKENETLKYQRFENLFYNMLNLQQEIVAGLRYDYEEKQTILVPQKDSYPLQDERRVDKVVTGREVFRFTFEEAEIYLGGRDKFGKHIIVQGYRRFLNAKGLSNYDETWIPTIFDHYFRHLYKIIQFVDNQGFSFDEAYKYISLLRGTLSRYELVWIYYNALNPVFHKFQELIEKYSLLKNLREDLLSRTLETELYIGKLGVQPVDLKNAGFSGLDFEFYLTDDKNDAERYYITAFWKEEEKKEGQELLKRWKMFMEDASGKVMKGV